MALWHLLYRLNCVNLFSLIFFQVSLHQNLFIIIFNMTVEEFRQIYTRLCKDHHVESQEFVLNALTKYVFVIQFICRCNAPSSLINSFLY